ncbi:MAG: hypothetical protein MHM6MM_003933 [Cercozoa sp. M6MM]
MCDDFQNELLRSSRQSLRESLDILERSTKDEMREWFRAHEPSLREVKAMRQLLDASSSEYSGRFEHLERSSEEALKQCSELGELSKRAAKDRRQLQDRLKRLREHTQQHEETLATNTAVEELSNKLRVSVNSFRQLHSFAHGPLQERLTKLEKCTTVTDQRCDRLDSKVRTWINDAVNSLDERVFTELEMVRTSCKSTNRTLDDNRAQLDAVFQRLQVEEARIQQMGDTLHNELSLCQADIRRFQSSHANEQSTKDKRIRVLEKEKDVLAAHVAQSQQDTSELRAQLLALQKQTQELESRLEQQQLREVECQHTQTVATKLASEPSAHALPMSTAPKRKAETAKQQESGEDNTDSTVAAKAPEVTVPKASEIPSPRRRPTSSQRPWRKVSHCMLHASSSMQELSTGKSSATKRHESSTVPEATAATDKPSSESVQRTTRDEDRSVKPKSAFERYEHYDSGDDSVDIDELLGFSSHESEDYSMLRLSADSDSFSSNQALQFQ